jgi:hypothetical protein
MIKEKNLIQQSERDEIVIEKHQMIPKEERGLTSYVL